MSIESLIMQILTTGIPILVLLYIGYIVYTKIKEIRTKKTLPPALEKTLAPKCGICLTPYVKIEKNGHRYWTPNCKCSTKEEKQ